MSKIFLIVKHYNNPDLFGKLEVLSGNGVVLMKTPITVPYIEEVKEKENLLTLKNVKDKSGTFKKLKSDELTYELYQIEREILSSTANTDMALFLNDRVIMEHNKNNEYLFDDVFGINYYQYKELIEILKKEIEKDPNLKIVLTFKTAFFSFFAKKVSGYERSTINKNLSKRKELLKEADESIKKDLAKNVKLAKQKTSSQINSQPYTQNSDDPFYTLIAFYYPELAISFKPNSTLAWIMYFNKLNDEKLSQSVIDEHIHAVSGYENVKSTLFNVTDEGYQVTLFKDENKETLLGVLNVSQDGNCVLSTPNGDKNCLTFERDGKIDLTYMSEKGTVTQMELHRDQDGYIGYWSTNEITNGLKSPVSVSSQLNVLSEHDGITFDPPVNKDVVSSVFLEKEAVNINKESVEQVNELKQEDLNTNDVSHAPNIISSWSSTDPYSN